MKHFILDFETIGANPMFAPALDCAYTTFEWERFLEEPYTFAGLVKNIQKDKLSIKEQIDSIGCSYTEIDLDFWRRQPKEVFDNIKPREDDLTHGEFIGKVLTYLQKSGNISYWWSRSNTFDPTILMKLAYYSKQYAPLGTALKHYKVRDTRTWIDAKLNFPKQNPFIPIADVEYWNANFSAHDSRHDVAADILRLQSIHRAEHDYTQTER